MYRDLLSTKGRKYGQRQRKLKTMQKRGIIHSSAQSISHAGYIVYGGREQPHEAKQSVSLHDRHHWETTSTYIPSFDHTNFFNYQLSKC